MITRRSAVPKDKNSAGSKPKQDEAVLARTITQLRAAATALERPEVRKAIALITQAAQGLTTIQARIARINAQAPATMLAAQSANAAAIKNAASAAAISPNNIFPTQPAPNATIYDALNALGSGAPPETADTRGQQRQALRKLVIDEVARAMERSGTATKRPRKK